MGSPDTTCAHSWNPIPAGVELMAHDLGHTVAGSHPSGIPAVFKRDLVWLLCHRKMDDSW